MYTLRSATHRGSRRANFGSRKQFSMSCYTGPRWEMIETWATSFKPTQRLVWCSHSKIAWYSLWFLLCRIWFLQTEIWLFLNANGIHIPANEIVFKKLTSLFWKSTLYHKIAIRKQYWHYSHHIFNDFYIYFGHELCLISVCRIESFALDNATAIASLWVEYKCTY